MKNYKILVAILLLLISVEACKKDDLTHGFGERKSISISSATLSISVGDTAGLSIVHNSRETELANQDKQFTWTVEGPAIVSILANADKSVSLKALEIGTTKLKVVSTDGTLSDVCEIVITKSNRLQSPVYIDFGVTLSDTPWNNIQNFSSGAILGLAGADGNNTGINIEVTDPFSDQNTSGVTSNTLGLPTTVTSDAFWGDNGNPMGVLKISNLNKSQKFNFSFYASRNDVTDNRETAYTIKGLIETTVYLNASSNKTQIAVANTIQPDVNGVVTVTVKAGPNNNNGSRYYYLGAMIIAPAP